MLDECKGERLEEVLGVFSNAVLKKVLGERGSVSDSIAQQLALENFSYTGERPVLSALILAHKASLCRHLVQKNSIGARYDDFSDLLNLNDRRIVRRHEELKHLIEERGSIEDILPHEIAIIQDQVTKTWSGSDEWLESLLYNDSRAHRDGLLGTPFHQVWRNVESGTIGDIEGKQHTGLVEQLDARIRDQEVRLARWQKFGRTLSKSDPNSPTKRREPAVTRKTKIDLGFNKHQGLQINGKSTQTLVASPVVLPEYSTLIENLKKELADVNQSHVRTVQMPRKFPPTLQTQSVSSSPDGEYEKRKEEEEWLSSASDTEPDGSLQSKIRTVSKPQTPPPKPPVLPDARAETHGPASPEYAANLASPPRVVSRPTMVEKSASPPRHIEVPAPLTVNTESEVDLADQILNSVTASSPSPKKPRHTLSLAERTRLSMSRASHSKYSELHDDVDNISDLPLLSIRTKPTQAVKPSTNEGEDEKHADLIERTRKSMAGFEAAQKKAQLERRQSIKNAKKKQRESSYFSRVDEEPVTPTVSAVELINELEEDPDYDMVFKSRPKIKTSPAVSPTRNWEEGHESE